MLVYKRNVLRRIRSIALAVIAPIVIYLFASIFIQSSAVPLSLSALALLALLYMAVFNENIFFELEGSALRYYKKNTLRQEFDLTNSVTRYKIKSDMGFPPSHNISLYIARRGEDGTQNETCINCTPLGKGQFLKMYRQMDAVSLRPAPTADEGNPRAHPQKAGGIQ